MIAQLMEAVEHGVSALLSKLKVDINDYCELETTSGGNLVHKNGAIGTVLRYHGYRTLLGKSSFQEFTKEFTEFNEPFLGRMGHMVQVVAMRDNDPHEEIRRILSPMYQSAEALQLDLTDLLEERVNVYGAHCMEEHVYIVLWTTKAVLSREELKLSQAESAAFRKTHKVPPMRSAQNLLRPLRFLEDRHETFVNKFEFELNRMRAWVERIDVDQAICEQRHFFYRSTPASWRPALRGDELIARWKRNANKSDVSEFMYPRLDDQIFLTPADIGAKGKSDTQKGTVTDTRAVRLSDRAFAPVGVKIPPTRPTGFQQFFRAINNMDAEELVGDKRVKRRVPWAISFMLEGDGLKALDLRATFSAILSFSQSNRNLNAAYNAQKHYRDNEHASIVKMGVMALTWAKHDDADCLMMRRSKLSSALQGWGRITVEEEYGDPIPALVSVAPGVATSEVATTSAPTLYTAASMLPLARPASPFPRGTTLFRSLDGKLLPYEFFSALQNTWVSLYFGGPGSGKSVLANRLNVEMCLMPGLKRLPFIGVIDIGISSSGFIKVIQDALPDNMKHLALYKRVQNTKQFAMNQGDTHLGLRTLLPRDRELYRNFLLLLVTPPERGYANHFMPQLINEVLDLAYTRASDQDERGSPKKFNVHINDIVGAAVRTHGIEHTEATTWWEMVDALFDLGEFRVAEVAQRYAVPTLTDILRAASDPAIRASHGDEVVEEFQKMIGLSDLDIFKGETQFDVSTSRIMALDLQDVAQQGSASARKNTTLMYMAALNAFTRKFSIIKEDLPLIAEKYRAYYSRRIEEYGEEYKRLFIDEYHKTGAQGSKDEKFSEILRGSIEVFGRESRKWMLEIALASQLPDDFEALADLATSIFILDQGNEQTRERIKNIFSLSETETTALRNYVKGALPGVGSTILAKIKTKDGDLSQLMTATSGGLELWALSTTGEDRALRTKLYEEMPAREARRILKQRFPKGTCKDYVMAKRLAGRDEANEGFIDDDLESSTIQQLAAELILQWRTDAGAAATA
ncbi:IcmB protein [Cupriavidus sp. TMH.W2]|uniref:IcmB protein n=1 Tax=Cupriavidus sp. TMH.W2 TaxID=3434465 RepID=UPI003D779FF0